MKMNEQTGRVIWITGLSGAGKTTVAQAAARCLRLEGVQPVVLDGYVTGAAAAGKRPITVRQ